MPGESLNGGLERPLCEALKVMSGLPWRPQDVGHANAVGYLLKKTANGVGQSEREKCVAVNKTERSYRFE